MDYCLMMEQNEYAVGEKKKKHDLAICKVCIYRTFSLVILEMDI